MFYAEICVKDEQLLPSKGSEGAACWDVKNAEWFTIHPWEIKLVGTGVKFYFTGRGYARMYCRSSLPIKLGMRLSNGVAIIDNDYTWEVMMSLECISDKPVNIDPYTRLAQIEFVDQDGFEAIVDENQWDSWSEVHMTERGDGWFWSTWQR